MKLFKIQKLTKKPFNLRFYITPLQSSNMRNAEYVNVTALSRICPSRFVEGTLATISFRDVIAPPPPLTRIRHNCRVCETVIRKYACGTFVCLTWGIDRLHYVQLETVLKWSVIA